MANLFGAAKNICELSEWKITNLELQKILYMAHMVYMGRSKGKRLIDTSFEAWDYGPVEPNLYHKVKAFGSKPIPNIFKKIDIPSDTGEQQHLREACENLIHLTPGQLVAVTHWSDGAWAENYIPGVQGIKIPDSDIMDEYRSRTK